MVEESEKGISNTDKDSGSAKPLVLQDIHSLLLENRDRGVLFVHRKIEKISSAIYLLTNFFSDQDPIKWNLRRLATLLIEQHVELIRTSGSREKISNVSHLFLELISLLEVARDAGIISEMNLGILKNEIELILRQINGGIYRKPETIDAIGPAHFSFPIPKGRNSQELEIGIGKKEETLSRTVSRRPLEESEFDSELLPPVETIVSQKTHKKLKEFSPISVKKNKRKSIIVNLLRRKKEVMIKDVMELVSDCSEKTIQRELSNLVDEGILSKRGERRWTKYSLLKG